MSRSHVGNFWAIEVEEKNSFGSYEMILRNYGHSILCSKYCIRKMFLWCFSIRRTWKWILFAVAMYVFQVPVITSFYWINCARFESFANEDILSPQ